MDSDIIFHVDKWWWMNEWMFMKVPHLEAWLDEFHYKIHALPSSCHITTTFISKSPPRLPPQYLPFTARALFHAVIYFVDAEDILTTKRTTVTMHYLWLTLIAPLFSMSLPAPDATLLEKATSYANSPSPPLNFTMIMELRAQWRALRHARIDLIRLAKLTTIGSGSTSTAHRAPARIEIPISYFKPLSARYNVQKFTIMDMMMEHIRYDRDILCDTPDFRQLRNIPPPPIIYARYQYRFIFHFRR